MIDHKISKLRLHKEFEMEFYYGIVLSSNDRYKAAYVDQYLYIWDIALNCRVHHYKEKDRISSLQFSQDGTKIAIGFYNSKLMIRDIITSKNIKTFRLDRKFLHKGDLKRIYFNGDILKVATNDCYTQEFSLTKGNNPQMRTNLPQSQYFKDVIFENTFSRALINCAIMSRRENDQIRHRTFYKQAHHGILQTANQIYCLDSKKLYIIYQNGRIIRKANQEQGVYRYAASRKFIACLKAKLLNIYDLSTGAKVAFKHDQLMSVIGINSKFVVVGDWPMRIYHLPVDLRVFLS